MLAERKQATCLSGAQTECLCSWRILKKFLRAVEKTLAHWSVFLAAKLGELLQLATLLRIQARRDLHDQPREQIAITSPVHVCYAFATQLEHLSALCACRDFNVRLPF